MKFNEKKFPIEEAAEDVLRALSEFIRRKHNMSDAIIIVSFVGLFIAVILRSRGY